MMTMMDDGCVGGMMMYDVGRCMMDCDACCMMDDDE
jgi:hypothetical protein